MTSNIKVIRELHDLGQSLWLDNITRDMLDDGSLASLIERFSITGLTSNPTIFNQAIGAGAAYDAGIREKANAGKSGEELFIELALEDLCRAADLFRPTYISTDHVDGWVSMEVSPMLAHDTAGSLAAAARIHAQANRPNLFVKIPATPEGLSGIEDSIFAGIPINVTLLFSREHYLQAAEAYLRGLERRLKAGLNLRVASVASLFVGRWDAAVSEHLSNNRKRDVESARERARYRQHLETGPDFRVAGTIAVKGESREALIGELPSDLRNRLGIAIAQRTYRAYRELLASSRWQALAKAGAFPQRLLWASTGPKDPRASETLYVEALAAPGTINTLPDKTLKAFADHGWLSGPMAPDGGDAELVLSRFAQAGIDIDALALRLQQDGVRAFVKSWTELLSRIGDRCARWLDPTHNPVRASSVDHGSDRALYGTG